ncbi:MAG TPA: signal peptidase II [Candidatus Izemoplasmatales bacterium]|nr:signal peptidase II [Bacillota bacterium]HRY78105.1 signal peptidase II [Candidatus Izemoplasmatales bacterium]
MLWLLALSVGLVVIDQVTKALVMVNLPVETDTLPIIRDFFHFTHVRNSGAVFGIGGDHGWLLFFFIFAALAATVLFAVMFAKNNFGDKRTRWYALSLSLLMAGTAGNLIDRIFQFDHQVVDFIDFRGIWPYVFNVADMCLCIGIGLFLFDQLFLEPKRVKKTDGGQ